MCKYFDVCWCEKGTKVCARWATANSLRTYTLRYIGSVLILLSTLIHIKRTLLCFSFQELQWYYNKYIYISTLPSVLWCMYLTIYHERMCFSFWGQGQCLTKRKCGGRCLSLDNWQIIIIFTVSTCHKTLMFTFGAKLWTLLSIEKLKNRFSCVKE